MFRMIAVLVVEVNSSPRDRDTGFRQERPGAVQHGDVQDAALSRSDR